MENPTIDNSDDYTLEVTRLNDEPLRPGDCIVLTEPYPGRVVIARAPIQIS